VTAAAIVVAAALAALTPSVSPRPSPASKVPDVVWSPVTAANAALVEAPIAEVTVFSDRARVKRRGRVAGASGIAAVRFPGLPGAAEPDSIRVSVAGGRVLRVEAAPRERKRATVAQAARLLDLLDAVADRLAEIDDRRANDDWEVQFLKQVAPAPFVPEEKREGRKVPASDVASWMTALDFFGARSRAAGGRVIRLEGDRRGLIRERDRLMADYKALDSGGLTDRIVEVVAIVELARPDAELELEYFIPGARWTPAYDLHYASARGQIRIETAAVVRQTTGEDWTDAALSFSTAMPGRGIDAPELLAWTLGEQSEFIPSARARGDEDSKGDTDHDGIPDTYDKCPDEPEDHDGEEDGCPEPVLNLATTGDEAIKGLRFEISKGRGRLGRLQRDVPADGKPLELPPAPVPAPAREAPGKRRWFSFTPSNEQTQTIITVAGELFDAPAAPRPELSDPRLPAVSAGGFDYVYRAPVRATIASSGKEIRIPLASQAFRTAVFHQATPSLNATAFLHARVRNDGKQSLLRGPVTIFGDGELVGVGEIQTTGPGGDIELPLGADQDVRLVRNVVPRTKTTGLIIKSDETTYDVTIQVGNYKKQKLAIEIADQIPRSGRDKVEVSLLGAQPAALGAPDADGVLRWRLELAPGATQTLKLSYRITRPKGWRLEQQ
jgi:hypothetical protein